MNARSIPRKKGLKVIILKNVKPSVSSFFSKFNAISKKYVNTEGAKNLSVDGTGILPSVDKSTSEQILNFIKLIFVTNNKFPLNVLDVGAGVGHLQKLADLDPFFNMYSFEGCSDLIKHFVCNKSRIAICDLTQNISDIQIKKAFHLTTSFEVLEHIHRSKMDIFWDNMKFLSDYHLCSIHCANRTSTEHCTIQSQKVWEDYFEKRNIIFNRLGNYPVTKENNEFRDYTGLHNWKFSAFYLLRLN